MTPICKAYFENVETKYSFLKGKNVRFVPDPIFLAFCDASVASPLHPIIFGNQVKLK